MTTISWSNFAKKNSTRNSGNSYTLFTEKEVADLVIKNWSNARPGQSETDLTRKILVTVPIEGFYCPPKMKLVLGMKVKCKITVRQNGEDPYLEKYITEKEAIKHSFKEIQAKHVDIVCYHKDVLIENGGKRSSKSDWEIVTILATSGSYEPMNTLAMARNYLEKTGGSKTDYSAKDFAESIYYWSCNSGIKVKLKKVK